MAISQPLTAIDFQAFVVALVPFAWVVKCSDFQARNWKVMNNMTTTNEVAWVGLGEKPYLIDVVVENEGGEREAKLVKHRWRKGTLRLEGG